MTAAGPSSVSASPARGPSVGVTSLNLRRGFLPCGLGALFGVALWASPVSAQSVDTAASMYIGASGGSVDRAAQILDRAARRNGVSPRFARGVVSLQGVYAPLADKARQIAAACGSVVISGVRHTRVAGTRHWSLHASGHAVDMRGNPACIYSHLHGWPGGYSIDYGRVLHVHISLGGREDGLRFAHHHVRRHTRYARR